MAALRPVIIGIGAAGAAATAIFTQPFRNADEPQPNIESGAYEVCLKIEIPLFENATAKCYGQEALLTLKDERILDLQGNPVTVTMAHPSDKTVPSRDLRTCRDYREMLFDGWYAATTSEMRREGYFVRACGALSAMFDAQAADRDYFSSGSPESEEVASLKGVLRIGETGADIDAVVVEQPGAFQWRIAADSQFVEIQELANADFDNDGIGEILVFLAGGTNGGSALFYDVGLIQKDAAEATLEFSPLSFSREDAAGAAG